VNADSADNKKNTVNPFSAGAATRHGFLYFTGNIGTGPKDISISGGIASIGGSPAFSFTSLKELPSGVTWWTNLSKEAHWQTGLLTKYKSADLFGHNWTDLMQESELVNSTSEVDYNQVISRWSETFARIAEFFSYLLDRLDLEPSDWGDGSFLDIIRSRFFKEEYSESLAISEIFNVNRKTLFKFSLQSWAGLTQKDFAGSKKISLFFPRWYYAKKMFKVKFPSKDCIWNIWENFHHHQNGLDKFVIFLKENKDPLLFQVDYISAKSSGDVKQTNLINLFLGNRGSFFQGATCESIWLTANEVFCLMDFASFKITSVYRGNKWSDIGSPEDIFDMPEPLLSNWSLSLGLIGHNIWSSLAQTARHPNSRKRFSENARSFWMKSEDRLNCFNVARFFLDNGFPILDYGSGRIQIAFKPTLSQMEKMVEMCIENGLVVPFYCAKKYSFVNFKQHFPTMFANQNFSAQEIVWIDYWIKSNGSVWSFVDIDRLVNPWKGTTVSVALKEAAQRLSFNVSEKDSEKIIMTWFNKSLREQIAQSVDYIKKISK